MKKPAKDLKVGDRLNFYMKGEEVTSVTLKDNHVYVQTDYTKRTAGIAYDLDKMQEVQVIEGFQSADGGQHEVQPGAFYSALDGSKIS